MAATKPKTKQELIDELQLKIKELELKLDASELRVDNLKKELLSNEEHVIKQNNQIQSLRLDAYDSKKFRVENSLLQISRLEAVKMLFDFMGNDASTHRQKNMFASQAKTVVTKQIDILRTEVGYDFKAKSGSNYLDDNLPF